MHAPSVHGKATWFARRVMPSPEHPSPTSASPPCSHQPAALQTSLSVRVLRVPQPWWRWTKTASSRLRRKQASCNWSLLASSQSLQIRSQARLRPNARGESCCLPTAFPPPPHSLGRWSVVVGLSIAACLGSCLHRLDVFFCKRLRPFPSAVRRRRPRLFADPAVTSKLLFSFFWHPRPVLTVLLGR